MKTLAVTLGLLTILAGTGYSQEAAYPPALVGRMFWCAKYENYYHVESGDVRDTPFKIVGYDGQFYEVEINEKKRLADPRYVEEAIQKGFLITYDPIEKQKQEETKQAAIRTAQIKAKLWPPNVEKAVIERKVRQGMTEQQAALAWGKPQHVNRSVGSWGVHEQWVYGFGAYLYFQNGILTSWQTTYSP